MVDGHTALCHAPGQLPVQSQIRELAIRKNSIGSFRVHPQRQFKQKQTIDIVPAQSKSSGAADRKINIDSGVFALVR